MILVLNLGLKSIRAIVFDPDGDKRATAARTVPTMLKGSWIEQDPEEWWALGMEVMGEALSSPEIRDNLAGITVTSSSCCLVCLDERGEVLRPAMMVSDHRAVEEAAALAGNELFVAESSRLGNHAAEPSFMIPKIMWLRSNEPGVFDRTYRFLASNDFLIARLCGEAVTDPLNAEKFFYRTAEEEYPCGLLNAVGIDSARLPRVVPQGTIAGELLAGIKGELGVPVSRDVPVVVTTYDAVCAFFGSGAHREGDGCDVSGTVTSLRVLSRKDCRSAGASVYSQHEAQTDTHIVGGSNNQGGSLIEWTKQCFYVGESHPYTTMEREASEAGPGAGGVVFLPYLLGERAPLWDMDARGVFFGLERCHRRPHMARAVFESAAYSLNLLKEAIEELGCSFQRLSVSGGLARIDLITQIKADVFQTEIDVLEEFETTSVGAFILCAMAIGREQSLKETSRFVRVRRQVHPDPTKSACYAEARAFYGELYDAARPLFARRHRLMELVQDPKAFSLVNL